MSEPMVTISMHFAKQLNAYIQNASSPGPLAQGMEIIAVLQQAMQEAQIEAQERKRSDEASTPAGGPAA